MADTDRPVGESGLPTKRAPLSDAAITELSLALEKSTGYDSIPTVDEMAERTQRGYLRCYMPRCDLTRPDAAALWRHLHFSAKHGYSFGTKSPEGVAVDA